MLLFLVNFKGGLYRYGHWGVLRSFMYYSPPPTDFNCIRFGCDSFDLWNSKNKSKKMTEFVLWGEQSLWWTKRVVCLNGVWCKFTASAVVVFEISHITWNKPTVDLFHLLISSMILCCSITLKQNFTKFTWLYFQRKLFYFFCNILW